MSYDEICEYVKLNKLPSFRAKQIYYWLNQPITEFSQMSNIPKTLIEILEKDFELYTVNIERKLVSKIDGTVKYLFSLHDGECIESVLMKYHHGYTLCISTQVGCRMGCSFCASGLNGLVRNLTASEMLAQIIVAQADNNIRISNVVMMGMGEPLDNFDNSVKFLKLVSDENGLNIGLRHISLSTSGVVSKIYSIAEYNFPITLSISLHAPTNLIRDKIMKVNHKWNIEELIKACKDYQKVTGRRISFEYAMINGVNDSDECALILSKLLKGLLCHVNLIPANPVVENDFVKSTDARVSDFARLLNGYGINTTVRRTLGADINASCGQLRRKTLNQS